MALFDALKNQAEHAIKSAINKKTNEALQNAKSQLGKSRNKKETFTFAALPTTVEELKALPEAKLDTPFKTAALALVALKMYEKDPTVCFAMLDFLRGPEPTSTYQKDFIKERIGTRAYLIDSFFGGATVENNYTPSAPYQITVSDNPYSYENENWATMWVTSAGADGPRPIKLRKKPSTGQWFLNDIQCLSDIRLPQKDNPWA